MSRESDYAPDPEEIGSNFVVPLFNLRERSASLVLGEPGAGKSTALARLAGAILDEGWNVELLDLKDCFSEDSLDRAFERLELKERSDGVPSVLLLDSVDETPGLIRNYIRFLERRLTRLVVRGWRVIGACRTAETVPALDLLFEDLEDGAVHVLLPLRRIDVLAIVQSEDIEPASFLDQVRQRRLDSLASIPFTLNLLCRIYLADRAFPHSRQDVFERAIALILAEESVQGYTPTPRVGGYPLRQKVAAERLACFATFAEAPGFGLFTIGEASSGTQTELLIGKELNEGTCFELSNEDFQNLLRTPLFATSGANERQFAHRRLRDYLAAKFLIRSQLELSQLRSLLLVADGQTIPPQMADVATWMVSLSPERFGWLISEDPLTLIRNRIADDLPSFAPRFVTELLGRAYEADRILSWRDDLSGLNHPGLLQQLRVALSSSQAEQVVALRVLRDSYAPGLEDHLVGLVNDIHCSIRVRVLAVEALDQHHADLALKQVKWDAEGFFDLDNDAQLRGALLEALWPAGLSIDALLRLLITPPQHYFGSYSSFVGRLKDNLSVAVASALVIDKSVGDEGESNRLTLGLPRPSLGPGLWPLIDAGVAKVLEHPTIDPPAQAAIVSILADSLDHKQGSLPFLRENVPEGRFREVISGVVERKSRKHPAWYSILVATDSSGQRLIGRGDVEWMADRANSAGSVHELNTWGQIIDTLLDSTNGDDFEWAWSQHGGKLWPTLSYRFESVALGSESAKLAKENWSIAHDLGDSRDSRAMPEAEYVSIVSALLTDAKIEPAKFWLLVRWLDVDLTTRRYRDNFPPDILGLANIRMLGTEAPGDILDVALDYLLESKELLPSRIRKNFRYFPLLAAYQALHTLEIHAPGSLDKLDGATWSCLTSAILEFPLDESDKAAKTIKRGLLAKSHAASPEGLAAAIRAFLGRLAQGAGEASTIADLEPYLGSREIPMLRSAIRADTFRRPMLMDLYGNSDRVAAISWVRLRVSKSKDIGEVSGLLGWLLEVDPVTGFDSLERFAQQDSEIVKPVLLDIAAREHHGRQRIHEVIPQTRVRVFELLAAKFPEAEEVFETGMHAVSPREDLADWRASLLASVVNGGTRDGLKAVLELVQRRPDLNLAAAASAAREAYRVNGWSALSIDELREVLDRSGARLARSNDDLLTIVVDALAEVQEWLIGETPQAFTLWDIAPGYSSPKDENRVSDWYCHALRLIIDRGGIIINREVEVTNVGGKGVGRRQDIRIEARDVSTGEQFVTVVEVKGIWNSGVRVNLLTQLAGDYLVGGNLTHGVYLVVNFAPSQISSKSKARISRSNGRGLKALLQSQANSVSPALTVIPIVQTASLPI